MTRFHATRRLLHVGVLLGIIATWALVANSWVPAAAALPIAGVLLFAFLESLLPIPLYARREVEPGSHLLLEDEARVRVHLAPSAVPLNLHVEDQVPEGLARVPGSQAPVQPGPHGPLAAYSVRARRRGDHVYQAVRVHRSTALGLFDRHADLPAATTVTVLPASAKNLGVRVRPRPPQRTGIATQTMRRGPGDEFFSLRQYQPGDDIGDVNWKATARTNRIITNEYLPEEPPRYLLYVDTRAQGSETGEPDVFERGLELASVLIEALLEARASVGLVLLSYHSRFLVPGSGQNQLNRLRDMIKRAEPGQDAPLRDLVMAGVAHLPQQADAVLVTANIYDATLAETLTLLRARHGRVVLLCPAYPEPDGTSLDDASRRASGALLNAEQASALAALQGLADAVAQWPPEEPIRVTLGRLRMVRTGR